MAKVVRNPIIFGEEVTDLAAEFAGISLTAVLNESLVAPAVRNLVPAPADSSMAKALNAATTALSALGLGMAIGMFNRNWGRLAKRGGIMLAGVQAVSVVVPGVSLSGHIPIPQLPSPAPTPAPQPALSTPNYGI